MNFIVAAVFILFLAIISVPLANRTRLPLEIFLVISSCLISFIPGLPQVEINPKIVFSLFLPPILFYAAYFTTWHEFKFNLRPISQLAFGLVIFTTVIIAVLTKQIFSHLSWEECFLFGAVISPTDASAATTLIKKFGAPRRIVTILEGESLINDATALIIFRFALLAALAGSFSMANAITEFALVAAGGVIVGIVIGIMGIFILQRINSPTAVTAFTFITALSAYLVADHLRVSGVIATVVAGLYYGFRFPELASSRDRLTARSSWDTLMFIINGFAFTLIGLELPIILKNLQAQSLGFLFLMGFLISLIVILVRLIWVFAAAYVSRLIVPSITKKDPMPSFATLFVIGWCGMRGIISLAAALSLPLLISTSLVFPQRDLILFLTYCVIIVTLIIPAFTLPFLLRYFGMIDSENIIKQESLARLKTLEAVMSKLQEIIKNEKIPETIFEEFRNQIARRINIIQTQISETPYSTINDEYQAMKRLAFAAIESERETLIKLRRSGEINDEVFHSLLEEVDLEEMRTKTLRL